MDFPLMSAPEGSDLDGSGCPSESLAEALAHVAHAMGVDDVRYYLNGALMSVSEGRATFVATNGHVLAKAEMELPIPDGKVIMPRQFVYACIRALKISPRDVYIRILHGAVSARIGETSITARAIQGEFPDWRRVIPGYSNDGVTIPKAALLAVLAHAKFLATDDMRSISVSFSPGSAKFSVEDKGGEDMEDMIDIEYSGAPVTISLNIRYLHGATDATRGQNVDIGFGDAQSAVIISAVPRAANVAVIMPMRK
jgi:DNA polymerase-3 subunit beta